MKYNKKTYKIEITDLFVMLKEVKKGLWSVKEIQVL